MPLNEEQLNTGRERLHKIYHYLQALNQHRNPVATEIKTQPWLLWLGELPLHEAITLGLNKSFKGEQELEALEGDDFILKVRRPRLTNPPEPPDVLQDWLEPGWEKPEKELRFKATQVVNLNQTEQVLIKFVDTGLNEVYQAWKVLRDRWAEMEAPARAVMKIFEHLYELYGWIQKEAERFELILGDGILNWRFLEREIHHPVLLLPLELEFNPQLPEFTLVETAQEVELYTAILNTIPELDGQIIARCREALQKTNVHPLEAEETSKFLQSFIVQLSPQGELIEQNMPKPKRIDAPWVERRPVVFVRSRSIGFSTAIEAIIDDLKNTESLPETLLNIIGVAPEKPVEFEADEVEHQNTKETILLGKPANPEQLAIAENLEQHYGVLVQGPPGTGKTHTIANLVGHLLAQGKSILVTSHATKALRVLQSQVEPELQPLCVSVLEQDHESRKLLEDSIAHIVERLSTSDLNTLKTQEAELAVNRAQLLVRLAETRQQLKTTLASEYQPIILGDQTYTPVEAARKLAAEVGVNDWIPGKIESKGSLPLTNAELSLLYQTNQTLSNADEQELAKKLPQTNYLPSSIEFQGMLERINYYSNLKQKLREEFWEQNAEDLELEKLESLQKRLLVAVKQIERENAWKCAAFFAGIKGGEFRKPWDNLLKMIAAILEEAAKAKESEYTFQPTTLDYLSLEEQAKLVTEIIAYMQTGRSLSGLCLLTKPTWKKFIQSAKVKGRKPAKVEDFQALATHLKVQLMRQELSARWEKQLAPLGAPRMTEFGVEIEQGAAQYGTLINNCLNWESSIWTPLRQTLTEYGFKWQKLLDETPPNLALHGEIFRLQDTVMGSLNEILEARLNQLRLKKLLTEYRELQNFLALAGSNAPKVMIELENAVSEMNVEAYHQAWLRLVELQQLQGELKLRHELLQRLEKVALEWASAIKLRQAKHGQTELPGDSEKAWLWRQLEDELNSRHQVSLGALQQQLEAEVSAVQVLTTKLIEARAWIAQLERTQLEQRQALIGYLEIIKRIGKGTGKRVPRLRSEIRHKMNQCRSAVPVWIMPLTRVVESFDPRTTKFDVVIIDEASQCDVLGLIAFYLGKKVIVVGDDEQVSPLAIGQKLDIVQHLIDEHLQEIPNYLLYDGQMSIYDLAKSSFGGTICLVEHFRCAPEIIEFSNQLSYNGRIKPLRDGNSIQLKPALIEYRVAEGRVLEKVNLLEAETVASLIIAALEQPEYAEKTFGVISLLGDEQSLEIDQILKQKLPAEVYTKHRLLCGNAAHFQGDERDVIFLSLVAAANGKPPLMLLSEGTQGMYKKRFNVAASRARDQMWLVHSLEPQTDLKSGDLRRNLLEYVATATTKANILTENDYFGTAFTREILKKLSSSGYQVHTQWKVGYYTIDLVVEGNGKCLAIECDGDAPYNVENLDQKLERQAILERLGWRFIHLRASQYYRDPEATLRSLGEKLTELGIVPLLEPELKSVTLPEYELKERVIQRAAALREEWAVWIKKGVI